MSTLVCPLAKFVEIAAAKFMDCAAQARIDLGKAERARTILQRLATCADSSEALALLH